MFTERSSQVSRSGHGNDYQAAATRRRLERESNDQENDCDGANHAKLGHEQAIGTRIAFGDAAAFARYEGKTTARAAQLPDATAKTLWVYGIRMIGALHYRVSALARKLFTTKGKSSAQHCKTSSEWLRFTDSIHQEC